MSDVVSGLPGPSLNRILRHAELTAGQFAALCGVTRRQLSYWVAGNIVPDPQVQPTVETLLRVMWVRAAMARGDSLRRAHVRLERLDAVQAAQDADMDRTPDGQLAHELFAAWEALAIKLQSLAEVVHVSEDPHRLRRQLDFLELERVLAARHDALPVALRDVRRTADGIVWLDHGLRGNPDPDDGVVLDVEDLLTRVHLNAAQAARTCGVTTRQMIYWTDRGFITPHNRRFDIDQLRTIWVVRELIAEHGLTLEQAVVLGQGRITQLRDEHRRAREVPAGRVRHAQRTRVVAAAEQVAHLLENYAAYTALIRLRRAQIKLEAAGVDPALRRERVSDQFADALLAGVAIVERALELPYLPVTEPCLS